MSVGDQICDEINRWEDQQDEIEAAVLAEREACAKIAEECDQESQCCTCDAAKNAAERIRARATAAGRLNN